MAMKAMGCARVDLHVQALPQSFHGWPEQFHGPGRNILILFPKIAQYRGLQASKELKVIDPSLKNNTGVYLLRE